MRRLLASLVALLLMAVGLFALPAEACACGAYVPSEGDAEIRGEASVVRFDGRTEDIIMRLTVQGESPEAAWILPVPTTAEVRLADADLFRDLVELTRPRVVVHKRWFPKDLLGGDGDGNGAGTAAAPSGAGVQVLERRSLGPFEVASLAATDAGALEGWLRDNGFDLSDDLAQGLQPYVDAGWRYVAARLRPRAGDEELSGTLQPLWVRFPTEEIVYPMRLSALADGPQPLSLFVLAEHRVARTDRSDDRYRSVVTYADWVDPTEAPAGSVLRSLVERRRFLTRVEANVMPAGVTDDYRFDYVADDVDVPTVERDELIEVAGIPAGPLLVAVALLGVLGGAVWLLMARRRHRPAWADTLWPMSSAEPASPVRGQRHRSRIKRDRQRRAVAALAALTVVLVAAIAVLATRDGGGEPNRTAGGTGATDSSSRPGGTAGSRAESSTTLAPLPPFEGWVNPASSGRPWSTKVDGLLTFRGNPTRTFYGTGPMPKRPKVVWSYPGASGGMCGQSSVDGQAKTWCGSGWTGQPSVWTAGGTTTVAFGAYDKAVHVLDAASGQDLKQPFPTGDIIKGSVTVDPDGFPLLYSGSRDDEFHVFAMDRGGQLEELWTLSADAVSPTKWNNDWDGSALVIDDYLFEGGENSVFHIVKLNRGYGPDGKVTVAPELVFSAPGWDDELLAAIGDQEVSIENSVAISGNTVYFANSGGLVQGWDISGLKAGRDPQRVFRFWTGDDTDASIVVDAEGMLYVASEYERGLEQARTNGQLMKLDPRKPENPLVWKVDDHDYQPGGIWATPALADGMVYVPTNGGRLLGVDQRTGAVRWTKQLPGPTWQSPVVIDGVLIQGDCNGVLHGYDVSEPGREPPELWQVELGGCIESTPAVWKGRIYVGTRAGRFFAIG